MDRVTLKHPKLPGEPTFVTTQAAYDVTWKRKGWELVGEVPDEDAPAAPPENLDAMQKAELEELAGSRGVDLSGAGNNAERVDLIRASYPEA